MKSMTGYAYREIQEKDHSIAVEVRSYNSRFLEIYVNVPPYLSPLEQGIRELVAGTCGRGKVEVNLRYRELNTPLKVTVNHEAAAAYWDAMNGLTEALHIEARPDGAGNPDLKTLIGLEGVLEIERIRDESRYWGRIEPLVKTVLAGFDGERVREGQHTQGHILSQIAVIEDSLKQVSAHVPEIEVGIKENLRSRFAELLGDKIDENRILAETAVLLMKYTISEELSRLQSHLGEFRAEVERNPSPGKKLDFLSQEMNREINTIGSKTPQMEVSLAVVEMKNALENVREQLRNVE